MDKNPILRIATKILFAPIILFGLYVQFHGDFGPGGGFQAGVIVASAFILYAIVFGLEKGKELFPLNINLFLLALAEFNEINGINTVFTDDYMVRWDIYVGTETTADGYEIYTIQHEGDSAVLGENVFMYKPDAYEIINNINNGDYYDKCVVYLEEFEDYMEELEESMHA